MQIWTADGADMDGPREKAADAFFNAKIDNSGVDAYTGRVK